MSSISFGKFILKIIPNGDHQLMRTINERYELAAMGHAGALGKRAVLAPALCRDVTPVPHMCGFSAAARA